MKGGLASIVTLCVLTLPGPLPAADIRGADPWVPPGTTMPAPAAPSAAPPRYYMAPPPAPAPMQVCTVKGVDNDGSLKVRSSPAPSASASALLARGAKVALSSDQQHGWLKIYTDPEQRQHMGWIPQGKLDCGGATR